MLVHYHYSYIDIKETVVNWFSIAVVIVVSSYICMHAAAQEYWYYYTSSTTGWNCYWMPDSTLFTIEQVIVQTRVHVLFWQMHWCTYMQLAPDNQGASAYECMQTIYHAAWHITTLQCMAMHSLGTTRWGYRVLYKCMVSVRVAIVRQLLSQRKMKWFLLLLTAATSVHEFGHSQKMY